MESLSTPLLTRYGVLADRVGAGKSLVALSLICDPPVAQSIFSYRESGAARLVELEEMPPVQEWQPAWSDLSGQLAVAAAMGWKNTSSMNHNRHNYRWHTRTSLLVVPHNVVSQWETYIREQTDIKAVIIKRTRDCDFDGPRFLQTIFSTELVVVSCTMLRKFIVAMSTYGPEFRYIVWSRLFIDEADTVTCGMRTGDVQSRFTWFITGSWLNMLFPRGLHNYTIQNLPESVRKMIGDGYISGLTSSVNVVAHTVSDARIPQFASLVLRNRDDWIDASLLRPTIVHETIMCKAPANLGVLRDFIPAAALEALHAGDTAGALTVMGIKASSKESIAEAVTAQLRGELLQAQKLLAFKRDMDYSSPAAKKEAITKSEAKVARLVEQLAALEARIAGAASGELCPICYDTPRTTTLTPCCRQAFCLSCICECVASKPSCPLCRQSIAGPKSLLVIGADSVASEIASEEAEIDPVPTKGAALLNLLSASTGDQRFLVFSAHEASFKGLRELLATRDIRCEVLQGTGVRIDRLRRQFRDGTVRVLCMNARHVGAGINLEAATHVVLYHRMNVELERQVIGRAVRFERSSELRVVHLAHEQETGYNGASTSEVIVHV